MQPHTSSSATTQKHLARLAGVSQATVSRALKGDPRIRPSLRKQIGELASKHGYVVNAGLRMLSEMRWEPGKRHTVNVAALIGGRFDALDRLGMIDDLNDYASRHGHRLDTWRMEEYRDSRRLDEILQARGTEGLFLLEWDDAYGDLIAWERYAVVQVGQRRHSERFHWVGWDYYGLVRDAVTGLLERGYNRVGALLYHSGVHRDDDQRAAGIDGCRRRYGERHVAPEYYVIGQDGNWTKNLASLKGYMDRERPDALIIFNEFFIYLLRDLGYDPPADLGIFSLLSARKQGTYARPLFNQQALLRQAVNVLDALLRSNERGYPPLPMNIVVPMEGYYWPESMRPPRPPQRKRRRGH